MPLQVGVLHGIAYVMSGVGIPVDTPRGIWDALSNKQGLSNLYGGIRMNAIATKFKVGAAAVAVAATAAVAPVAANAAPAVQFPAAPAMSDLAQQPQGLFGVFVVQFTGAVTRTSTYWTRYTILNYQSKLEANPDSPFASFYQRRIDALNTRLASYGEVALSSCFAGRSTSIVAGSYGAVTTGSCVS